MPEVNLIKFDGKPIEKLIDVISRGIGTLYRPKANRKDAEAKAYEIEIIERARSKALADGKEIEAETYNRIQTRLPHQELKRQQNIDNISSIAADQFNSESQVSVEPVNDDWTTRFFNIAADISNEEMQKLWGRILAGEVKQPKSFSFRTLELLKNISKEEADIFTKFAEISLYAGREYFVVDPDKGKFLEEEFKIKFSDRLLLLELGLILSKDNLGYSFNPTMDKEKTVVILYGNKGFFVLRKKRAPQKTVEVILFSKLGEEIIKLINPIYNEKYNKKICAAFKDEYSSVRYGDTIRRGKTGVTLINYKEY